MNNQKRAIIAAGGTGGHVLPGCNLALHLQDIDYKVELITDIINRNIERALINKS